MTAVPLWCYMLAMALVTYLVRLAPFVLFRKKIRSRFIRSFLLYIPYGVLSAMTIPGIFLSTEDIPSAVCGLAVAILLSLRSRSLLVVAVSACATAYIVSFLLTLF